MEFKLVSATAEKQNADCVVVGVHEGRKLSPSAQALDQAGAGEIMRLVRISNFEGGAGQTLLLNSIPNVAAERVLLVGLGKPVVAANAYRKAARNALTALKSSGARNAAIYLHEVEVKERDAAWATREVALASHEALYLFDRCKGKPSKKPRRELKELRFGAADKTLKTKTQQGATQGAALAAGLQLAKDLGNSPGNICTPTYLANEAKNLAKRYESITTTVKSEADMKRLGMGSLLSVSRGSDEPAKLIIMEYGGGKKGQKPTVLVGKGVTFDTGGISLKPGGSMDEMKFDMCGAASVFGTLEAIAQLGLATNVVGIVPATENMPSGTATKPGDIVTSMSGQTIEILNTDAEGRLILCDALTYAERFQPDVVVDIATLTGACVIALGAHASGLFSNNRGLADGLLAAGEYAGDRAWEMPVWDEYDEQLKSNFADMANIGGREAGAVTAACFLARFTRDYRWAHLDIAGAAWHSGAKKGSTGRPVRLLVEYLLNKTHPRSG